MGRKKLPSSVKRVSVSFCIKPEFLSLLGECSSVSGLSRGRLIEISLSRFGLDFFNSQFKGKREKEEKGE